MQSKASGIKKGGWKFISKKWYPVINYGDCIVCGACVQKCKNGVYEPNTAESNVIHPEDCIYGCKGCQKLCPVDAIDYVGDTGRQSDISCSCSCDRQNIFEGR